MLYYYSGTQLTHNGQNKNTDRVECLYLRYHHQGMMPLEVGGWGLWV